MEVDGVHIPDDQALGDRFPSFDVSLFVEAPALDALLNALREVGEALTAPTNMSST
jgi:hypothetical protein